MTKMDIVKALSKTPIEGVSLTQDQAKEILDATLSIITDGMKEDGVTQITGFGTFKCRHVEAREGHNPKNPDEKIMIAARNQVTFTCGSQLKADVNETAKKKVATTTAKKKVAKKKK
jgi:DNA-binding protein HU-beta